MQLIPYGTYDEGLLIRSTLGLSSSNGGVTLFSNSQASAPGSTDGGVNLVGTPVNVILHSSGTDWNNGAFRIWDASGFYNSDNGAIFTVDGTTRNSLFHDSDVSITGGSLSVTGNLSAGGSLAVTGTLAAGGSDVITAASASTVLTGQNFVKKDSSGRLTLNNTSEFYDSGGAALTVWGGISSIKDSSFNGVKIGKGVSTGSNNTVLGFGASGPVSSAANTTAVGYQTLTNNTGSHNTAVGAFAMQYNTTGASNTAMGREALFSNLGGGGNVALGATALRHIQTGSNNVAIGVNAGKFVADGGWLSGTTGSIYIGASTRALVDSTSNEIVIGNGATSEGAATTVIGNSATTATYLRGETNSASLKVAGSTVLKGDTVLEGNTVIEGDVVLAEPQGDISMGDYQ